MLSLVSFKSSEVKECVYFRKPLRSVVLEGIFLKQIVKLTLTGLIRKEFIGHQRISWNPKQRNSKSSATAEGWDALNKTAGTNGTFISSLHHFPQPVTARIKFLGGELS